MGFAAEEELSPAAGFQLYVFPATGVEPIAVDSPSQIVLEGPASATGLGFTVMIMLSDFEQPVAVMVSVRVYVVVPAGKDEGFEIMVEFRPAAGLHK